MGTTKKKKQQLPKLTLVAEREIDAAITQVRVERRLRTLSEQVVNICVRLEALEQPAQGGGNVQHTLHRSDMHGTMLPIFDALASGVLQRTASGSDAGFRRAVASAFPGSTDLGNPAQHAAHLSGL
jgi:hypothetical protein